MLAIRSFRRLWVVTAVSSTGDWLSLLALSALATQLVSSYQAKSFVLGGVVATKLLPAMIMAPLAGPLADRFDRRAVMVVCDLLRFSLFFSIPLVGSLGWLFAATFLIEICSLFWIPAKDASVPNLLRRRDQVETANQLGLVMTYGVAVITAAGLFTVISKIGDLVGSAPSPTTTVYIALMINGGAYLLTALTVWFRIPEISGRPATRREVSPGLLGMLREGAAFVGSTPLIRGLVAGIVGAFAAGGAVIASAKLYASSLGGGNASYGLLFVALFVGLAGGMGLSPRLSRRMPRHRLFGVAIVAAGLALVLVAVAWHLSLALVTVALVGVFAGIAFLTGLTIIGAQVEDAVRGRIVAFVQSVVRLDLLASMSVVPLLIGVVQSRTIDIGGHAWRVDGSRFVLAAAGLLAAGIGVVAYRQMDDRCGAPILAEVMSVLHRRERPYAGLLVAVEGRTPEDTAAQAQRLADWLRVEHGDVVVAGSVADDESRIAALLAGGELLGPRSRALAAAAVRADVVEQRVRPALRSGAVVVIERYVDSPMAQLGAAAGLDSGELESLTSWATGRLRPDITVLLDRRPAADAGPGVVDPWRVQRILTEMAAAEPDRYVVVEAEDDPDVVAGRVRDVLAPVVASRVARMAPGTPRSSLVGPRPVRRPPSGTP